MAVTSDDDDENPEDASYDTGAGWTDDEPPMQQLLDFVATGSRLTYDYFPIAAIGGATGWLKLAPTVSVARYENHHEYITGVYFISGVKFYLNYDELVALIKFMEVWLIPCDCRFEPGPAVQAVHYETYTGFAIRTTSTPSGLGIQISLGCHGSYRITSTELQQIFHACQRLKMFLDKFRE